MLVNLSSYVILGLVLSDFLHDYAILLKQMGPVQEAIEKIENGNGPVSTTERSELAKKCSDLATKIDCWTSDAHRLSPKESGVTLWTQPPWGSWDEDRWFQQLSKFSVKLRFVVAQLNETQ